MEQLKLPNWAVEWMWQIDGAMTHGIMGFCEIINIAFMFYFSFPFGSKILCFWYLNYGLSSQFYGQFDFQTIDILCYKVVFWNYYNFEISSVSWLAL